MFKRRFLLAASRVWTHRRPSHQRIKSHQIALLHTCTDQTNARLKHHSCCFRKSGMNDVVHPINRIPQIWGELRSGTPTDRTIHLTVKPGSQRYSRVIRAQWFQLRGCKTNLQLTGFKLEELIIPIDANQLSVDRSASSLFSLVECQQVQVRWRWCHPYLTINQMQAAESGDVSLVEFFNELSSLQHGNNPVVGYKHLMCQQLHFTQVAENTCQMCFSNCILTHNAKINGPFRLIFMLLHCE